MKVAVLGSGNGGHATAFDFSRFGYDVYVCDFESFPQNIAAIAAQGGVYADGEMEGFQKVVYAGHDFETAVKDADVVMVVATANAVVPFAEACKPYIHDGQMFIVSPGSCFGAIEFKTALGYDLDDERIAFGKACGVEILDDPTLGLLEGYMYNATYDEGYIKSPGFAGIMAPTTADHRYFDEDVNALCLWEDIGRYLNLPTTTITSMINICNVLRNKDYRSTMTKSVKGLGLDKYPPEEIGQRI